MSDEAAPVLGPPQRPLEPGRRHLQDIPRADQPRAFQIALEGAADLDAVIFPGGFGAAKNLCDFAVKGAGATPNPEVARLLKEMAAAKKPIGAICIAPSTLALTSNANTRLSGTEMPASAGVHGPGEITICSGSHAATSLSVIASLR